MPEEQPPPSHEVEPPGRELTPEQKEVIAELARFAPRLAELYRAAVIFLSDTRFPGRNLFLAHAVREIANSLPDALEDPSDRRQFDWKGDLRKLQTQWDALNLEAHWPTGDPLPETEPAVVPLPWGLYTQIRNILIDFQASDERNRDKAVRLFRNMAPEVLARHSTQRSLPGEWFDLIESFKGPAHESRKDGAPEVSSQKTRSGFNRFEDSLRFLLPRLGVVQALDEIDAIVSEANRGFPKPTEGQVDEALSKLGRPVVRQRFFETLENPEWLQPLRAGGMFSSPPDVDSETGVCPYWPEARYLARVASARSGEFVEILREMQPTRNPTVVRHLLDGLLAVPPEVAVTAIPVVTEWIKKRAVWLPDPLTKLIVGMAERRLTQPALELARSLLQVLPDPDASKKRQGLVTFLQARAVMESYLYDQECHELAPVLARAAGVEAVKLFAELLSLAMEYEGHHRNEGRTDYSHVYRPDIEQPRHPGNSIIDSLVDGLRESLLIVLDQRPEEATAALDAVRSGPSRLFDRIELFALSKHPRPHMPRIAALLQSIGDFNDSDAHRELRGLLHAVFGELPADVQERYLRWVDEQPDLQEEQQMIQQFSGTRVTEDEVRRIQRRRVLCRLRPIKDRLDEGWRGRYEELIKEFPEPSFPEPAEPPPASWPEEKSPITAEELLRKSVPDIAEYLRCQPAASDERRHVPPWEGLPKELAVVAEKAAPAFAKDAKEFVGLPSRFVRSVLDGLQNAVSSGVPFDWAPVLKLCQWVVDQPYDQDSEDAFDLEPQWGWCRSAVLSLATKGMDKGDAALPFELRKNVWQLIERLIGDTDPRPETEARDIEGQRGILCVSLNTRRGQAMHAVMKYALWCRRQFEGADTAEELKAAGFDAMPEVRATLEQRLDIGVEPSRAVRAVYGRWFPWIAMLDRKWASDNTDRVFPRQAEAYWEAAWDAYISSCPPYTDVYRLLSAHYAFAVDRLARPEREQVRPGNSDMDLTGHLLQLYSLGKLDLRGGPFVMFWKVAPTGLREHAFASVGFGLRRSGSKESEDGAGASMAPEVMHRLRALCECRIKAAESASDPEAFVEELAGFGYWFDKDEFDGPWAVTRLRGILALRGAKMKNLHHVLERMATLQGDSAADVLACLRKIVTAGSYPYALDTDAIKAIIGKSLSHEEQAVRREARDLADLLVGLGHLQFRDILRNGATEGDTERPNESSEDG